MIKGTVELIHTASQGAEKVTSREEIVVIAGRGIEGDRYYEGKGTFSKSNRYAEGSDTNGRDLTLIEAEAVEGVLNEYQIEIEPGTHRRNITTRGVALNDLVGKKFRIGEVVCKGICLCTPCRHMEALTTKGVMEALENRGGLRADILGGGVIKVGAMVEEIAE